jgi:hypothetical protein
LKNDVNVPSKSNKKENLEKKIVFSASWRSMMKIAGSGDVSIRQRHGSPDPYIPLCLINTAPN